MRTLALNISGNLIFILLTMKTFRFLILFPALVPFFISGCGGGADPAASPEPRPVKLVRLSEGGLARVLEYPGHILPLEQADMAFEVPGQMVEIAVTEGQKVTAGELLARLDDRSYAAELKAARARFELAQLEAERARSLFEQDAATKQQADLAESEMQVAEAAFDQAQKAHEETRLRAPIDGIVAKVLVEDIVNVQAKQLILIIQDISQFRVEADLPETLGAETRPGLTIEERNQLLQPEVLLSILPGRSFSARIQEFSVMADPATRTFSGTFLFKSPDDVLVLPGMTAKVRMTLPRSQRVAEGTYVVPTQAVRGSETGTSFVWRRDPGTGSVERVPVRMGHVAGELMEIIAENLSPGDEVVASGVLLLEAGDRVREIEL